MIFVYLISLIHSYFFHYFISVGQDQKQLDNLETHSQSKNMEKGKADVDNDVNYICFLINTKENIYNNRNSHQGDKTEISWCCVFQISQGQGAGKKKRTKKKTRRRFNASAYNSFDFKNTFGLQLLRRMRVQSFQALGGLPMIM